MFKYVTKTFLISVYIRNKFDELITNYFKEVMRLYTIVYVNKRQFRIKKHKNNSKSNKIIIKYKI